MRYKSGRDDPIAGVNAKTAKLFKHRGEKRPKVRQSNEGRTERGNKTKDKKQYGGLFLIIEYRHKSTHVAASGRLAAPRSRSPDQILIKNMLLQILHLERTINISLTVLNSLHLFLKNL